MPDLRLISAEVLKLRRRRGMLAVAALLTLGIVVVAYTVSAIQHGTNPGHYGPPGGRANYVDALSFIEEMALVAGAIVGATAGTQDIETGVFRDLAATGRSRLALFGARVAGAWIVMLPLLLLTMLVMDGLAVAMAGSSPVPHADTLASGTLSILAAGAMGTAMAVGLSALVGSRGPVIATMLAFLLALQPVLINLGFLGAVRDVVPVVDVGRIAAIDLPRGIHVGLAAAVAALLAWAAAPLALGAWKTATREI